MCGISGMIGLSASEDTIHAMQNTMACRGPDASGIYRDGDVTLFHTRLAVIDPKGGEQPMSLDWEGETYVLVYNGELYNTNELRDTLRNRGHSFRGYSDTEVVLHAYAELGPDCVHEFNGIFAFAIWERKNKHMFLARDRIGVKPLFYMLWRSEFVFASEIKTILAHPSVPAELDRDGAAQLLLLGPGRLPGSGVFRNIREIKPGFRAYYAEGRFREECYWRLTDREHTQGFPDTAEYVRFLVTDAIRRQMVSDVPIGTFLSGGLDSSIITAVCAGVMDERGERLNTFSVDYADNDLYFEANRFQPDSDNVYIRMMRETFHTNHHSTVLTPENLLDALEAATIARDLPGMADVDFSLLSFCADVRKKVTVALSGECADEIFGGYPWYRDPEIRSRAGFPWAQNTNQRQVLLHQGMVSDAASFIRDAYEETCRQSDILPGTSAEERRMKEMVNLNFQWFMQTLLDRKDRMSMYHSLEVRVPFCDHRIAEYLYGVPWEYKNYQGREKGLLRAAMKDLLPEAVLQRKKSPYPKTFDPHYEAMVAGRLRELLAKDAPLWELVRKDAVRQLLEVEYPQPWYGQLMRRPQTIAYLLQMEFWLRHYQIHIRF